MNRITIRCGRIGKGDLIVIPKRTRERLCWKSSVFYEFELIPLEVLPDHCVEDCYQLAHARDDDNFVFLLADGFQACGEGLDDRVATDGGDRGHVERGPDGGSAAADGSGAFLHSRVAVERHDAD